MTLQKKQVYLNKVLSKHYKKLKHTFFNKTNIPAFRTTAITDAQSIHISVLTIDAITHKDFPSIVDVTFLNGLRKTKKAVIIYQGKTKVSTIFTRSIHKLTQKPEEVKHVSSLVFNPMVKNQNAQENPKASCFLKKAKAVSGKFAVINKMLGAGINMYNYRLCFNSPLSLQHYNVLKYKEEIKLKDLDRFEASLIPSSIPETPKIKGLEVTNREALKTKEVRLSKTELSSIITQLLYKTHFLKGQESSGESFFNIKKLSNILGALVEINSKIYYISDKELKQCGLVGGLKHLALNFSNNLTPTSLLKDLLHSKATKDKRVLLNTKFIQPNIVFFNFLNIAARTYVIHNIKRIFSKLINILSIFVLPKCLPQKGKSEKQTKQFNEQFNES